MKIIDFINGFIKFCSKYQCIREEYKVLISCAPNVPTIIWILIAIVVIVVFVIISAIVFYYIREYKPQTCRKTQPTDILELASTVKTVDSETGLPIGIYFLNLNISLFEKWY